MAVISPPRQPDSHDAEFTVEPDRGGEALIEEAKQHARKRRRRTTIGVAMVAALVSVAWAAALAFGLVGTSGARGPELGVTRAEGVRTDPVPSAELVASFYTHWSAGKDQWIYVYDDGRVVFMQRGWQQRVLTPDGLALLRAGIIASGILGPTRYAEAHQFGPGAFVQLRIDGVLTAAWQPPRTADYEVDAFNRVIMRLSNFDRWLPAEAWAQPAIMPYVPPGYAVCVSGENANFLSAHDDMLPHLPDDAAALLAAGPRIDSIDPQTDGYAGNKLSPSSDIVGCRHLAPGQAQSFVDTLVREGWGLEDSGPPREDERVVLAERERINPFDMSTTLPRVGDVRVFFSAVLPHGVPECACYG